MHSLDKRIFISKNASEIDPYRAQFTALGYTVVNHSFLSFYPIESEISGLDIQHEYDVIFFGSPRAVVFFKANHAIGDDKLVGCVGGKTAELLASLGHTPDFVGTRSGEPKIVGEEFKAWLGDKRTSAPLSPRVGETQHDVLSPRVLFPISDRSLKTISSVIDDGQKEELVVYSTEVVGKVVEECDVYVFTSPSNVEGFLLENVLPEGAELVAWGKSTEDKMNDSKTSSVSVDFTLERSEFEALLDYLRSK